MHHLPSATRKSESEMWKWKWKSEDVTVWVKGNQKLKIKVKVTKKVKVRMIVKVHSFEICVSSLIFNLQCNRIFNVELCWHLATVLTHTTIKRKWYEDLARILAYANFVYALFVFALFFKYFYICFLSSLIWGPV